MLENADQNKSEYGHFLRSGNFRSFTNVSDQGICEVRETLLLPNSLIILHIITLHSLQSGFQESPGHEVFLIWFYQDIKTVPAQYNNISRLAISLKNDMFRAISYFFAI